MTTINIYLTFNGNCEAAFNFYKSVFGGDFKYLGRYKDVPKKNQQLFPNNSDEQIMHVSLPISKETILMGADHIGPNKISTGTRPGFSLFLNTDSVKEADRLFGALSKDGNILVPIAKQFWNSYYGLCEDKFGIHWKISVDLT